MVVCAHCAEDLPADATRCASCGGTLPSWATRPILTYVDHPSPIDGAVLYAAVAVLLIDTLAAFTFWTFKPPLITPRPLDYSLTHPRHRLP